MRDIRKDLALLFAGALASVIGGILLQPPVKTRLLWVLGALVVALILYGSGAVSKARSSFRLWRRKSALRVGILNDMGWDANNSETHAWCDISPEQWKTELENQISTVQPHCEIEVKLIDTASNFDSYIAILNPYGGVYPELDLKTSATLNKIFNYVNKGGIFLNVADIPGYWAYNKLLERRLDATPAIYGIDGAEAGRVSITPVRPFMLTPFMERLGLQVYATDAGDLHNWNVELSEGFEGSGKPCEIKVHRVAVVEKNVIPIIRPRKLMPLNNDTTPFFMVNYGEGRFLVSLVFESFEDNARIQGIISGTLIKLIHKRRAKT